MLASSDNDLERSASATLDRTNLDTYADISVFNSPVLAIKTLARVIVNFLTRTFNLLLSNWKMVTIATLILISIVMAPLSEA